MHNTPYIHQSRARLLFVITAMKFLFVTSLLLILLAIATASASASSSWSGQLALDGSVIVLNESNFDTALSTFDYIFVDFYAPWCGHCKQLNPELDKAAAILAELKHPVVIAKVDVDKYKSIAKKHEIDAFPTLKIFNHGVPTEYYGSRKSDMLVRFLKKFVAPDVTILKSDSEVREFVKEAGPDFPIFIGFGVNESMILNQALKYKRKAWFAVAKDFSEDLMSFYDFDKVPALAALLPSYSEQSIFYGPFEEEFLEQYIKQSLLPLVVPINQETLQLLKSDGRKIALTIVDDDTNEKAKEIAKLLKAAASANRDLVFGYVGVKQFEEFVESFDVKRKTQLPMMIVWDGNEGYVSVNGSEWIKEDDQGSEITRFLEGYREGRVIQKRVGLSLMDFLYLILKWGSVLTIIFIGAIMIMVFILTREPKTVGTRQSADRTSNENSQPESAANFQQSGDKKED